MKLQRYDIRWQSDQYVLAQSSNGEWCRSAEAARLEAQNAEMLAALKRIYEISANCPCEVTDEELNAYSQARAAIAKAEGEGV